MSTITLKDIIAVFRKDKVEYKMHCEVSDVKYYACEFDDINGMYYYDFCASKEDALNYACNVSLNMDKSIDDFDLTINKHGHRTFHSKDSIHKCPSFVEEYDGKLYNQWVYYSHDEFGLLFDPNKYLNCPKTKKELREYLADGNVVEKGWGSRSQVSVFIGNMFHFMQNIDAPESISYVYPFAQKEFLFGFMERKYVDGNVLWFDPEYRKEEFFNYKLYRL